MTPRVPRRLYWSTAIRIALALLAFVALSVASVVFLASRQLDSYMVARHGTLAQQAATVLSAEGSTGLQRWIRANPDIPPDVTVYILDGKARDILGRPLPGYLEEFVRRSVVSSAAAESTNLRPVRLAPLLVAGDQRYTFLVLPKNIGLLGNLSTTLGVLVIALGVIAVVAWSIARSVGRPIGEIQAAARELALGHVEARVPQAITARRDELGSLAADFNAAAEKIVALLATRQRLMGDLSHELRSPLTRLQAAVALAQARYGIGAEDLARIEREIVRMDGIIGDLLRYAKLDAAMEMQRKLVRLDALLADLVDLHRLEAETSGCTIRFKPAGPMTVLGDQELLRSAFENVLRNAIRHAARGGDISVGASLYGEVCDIRIEDRGPGVPEEALGRIFEPFVRVAATKSDAAGAGLGLAIAKRVVGAHGGSITARNRIGGGLSVAITLPAIAA